MKEKQQLRVPITANNEKKTWRKIHVFGCAYCFAREKQKSVIRFEVTIANDVDYGRPAIEELVHYWLTPLFVPFHES